MSNDMRVRVTHERLHWGPHVSHSVVFEAPHSVDLLPLSEQIDRHHRSLYEQGVEAFDAGFVASSSYLPGPDAPAFALARYGPASISCGYNERTAAFLDTLIVQYAPGTSYDALPALDVHLQSEQRPGREKRRTRPS